MLEVPVMNEAGEQVATEQLDPQLLGGEPNAALLKQAVVMYRNNLRQGTVSQKTRGETDGSTRKIYRQKGTGRARMGTVRTPVRRGGGRAFPRKPRDFRQRMPKKMRRLACKHAILAKLKDGQAIIVEDLSFDPPRTKRFAGLLSNCNVDRGCLFTTDVTSEVLYKSSRNIPKVEIMPVAELNAFAVLRRRQLVFTRSAFELLRRHLVEPPVVAREPQDADAASNAAAAEVSEDA